MPGGKYGFLFYESLADPSIFRLDEGFVVKAEQREQTYRRVLEAYGLQRAGNSGLLSNTGRIT